MFSDSIFHSLCLVFESQKNSCLLAFGSAFFLVGHPGDCFSIFRDNRIFLYISTFRVCDLLQHSEKERKLCGHK